MLNYVFLFVGALVAGVVCEIVFRPCQRYEEVGGQTRKAWHILLPGYEDLVQLEHVFELRKWAGSSYDGLTVQLDGERNPQLEAEPALRGLGIVTEEYVREQLPNGDWVLRRPEKHTRVFSWRTYRRISPWVVVS